MGLFPLSVERHVNSAVAEHAFGVTTVTRAAQYTAFHGLIAEEATKRGLTKEAVDQPNARIADLEAAVEPAQADSALGNGDSRVPHDDIEAAARNFGLLLSKLAEKQRVAERAETVERISSRINRAKRDFMRTHEKQARNEDVLDFIEEISGQVDLSPEAEEIRAETRRWLTQFGLVEDSRALVHDLPGLFRAMDGLAYQATRGAQRETPTSDDDEDSGSSER